MISASLVNQILPALSGSRRVMIWLALPSRVAMLASDPEDDILAQFALPAIDRGDDLHDGRGLVESELQADSVLVEIAEGGRLVELCGPARAVLAVDEIGELVGILCLVSFGVVVLDLA